MSMFVPLRALAHFQVVLEIPSTNIPDKEISYMLKPIPLSQAIASGDCCGSSGYLHVNAKSEGGILIVEVTTGNGSGSNSTPVPPLTTIPGERHEHSSAESTSYLVANPYSDFSNFALESEGNRISGAIGDTVIPKESPLSPNGGDVVRDDATCGVPADWSADNVGSLIGALSGFEYSNNFFPSAEYDPIPETVEFDFGQSSSPGLDNRSETLSTTPLSSPETENPVSEQHIVQEEPRPKRYARNPRARIFPCKVAGCDRSFATHYNRETHMLSHRPKRKYRYPCTMAGCDALFSRNHDRHRHEVSQHGKRTQWECPFCKQCFPSEGLLSRHRCA